MLVLQLAYRCWLVPVRLVAAVGFVVEHSPKLKSAAEWSMTPSSSA